MGASASVSLCSDPSAVRIRRHNTKISPEPVVPDQDASDSPVFGVALQRLREDGQLECGVPRVLKHMVEYLDRNGVQQRGLFRLPGSVVRTRQLRLRWDQGERVDLEQEADVPTVASLLKLFLRELPRALVPEPQRKDLLLCLTECANVAELNSSLREKLQSLPADNHSILSYLIHFLFRVASHSQSNHMPMENLATVFGPCVFHVPAGPGMLAEQSLCNTLLLHLLRHQALLFTPAPDPLPHHPPPTRDPTPSPPPPPLSALSNLQAPLSTPVSEASYEGTVEGDHSTGTSSTSSTSQTWTLTSLSRYRPEHLQMGDGVKLTDPEKGLGGGAGGGGGGGGDARHVDYSDLCYDDSPSLKLQALEAELGPPDPELGPPLQEPGPEPGHAPCAEDHPSPAPSDLRPHPQDQDIGPSHTASGPVRRPPASPPPSPNASPLLQRLAAGDCPLPSPRCSDLSRRYDTDPDVAPSPPCSQHVRMARCTVRAAPAEGAKEALSLTLLNRHISQLRRRIRGFEERFEQERHYRPAHNDKTADPEMCRLMKELTRSHKQLKELKLRLCATGLSEPLGAVPPEPCGSSRDQQGAVEPSPEETVLILTRRLRDRRRELRLPDDVKDMSQTQMALEKISLQKCLLYFESLHGRPSTKQERTLMKPLYDRYRRLKQLLCTTATTPVITTIEEEGSDEDTPPRTATRCVSSDESLCVPLPAVWDTPLVSPLEEVKGLQAPGVAMASLHGVSRPELLEHIRAMQAEKKRVRIALREFEDHFYSQTGRSVQKEDRSPMAEEYCQYKSLKAKLRLMEALLSKQDTHKMC